MAPDSPCGAQLSCLDFRVGPPCQEGFNFLGVDAGRTSHSGSVDIEVRSTSGHNCCENGIALAAVYHGCENRATIAVLLEREGQSGMQISIKTLTGKTIAIDAQALDTIDNVDAQTQGKDGILRDQQATPQPRRGRWRQRASRLVTEQWSPDAMAASGQAGTDNSAATVPAAGAEIGSGTTAAERQLFIGESAAGVTSRGASQHSAGHPHDIPVNKAAVYIASGLQAIGRKGPDTDSGIARTPQSKRPTPPGLTGFGLYGESWHCR